MTGYNDLKHTIPLRNVPHLLPLELVKQDSVVERIKELYQEFAEEEHGFFLDAVVETDTSIPHEYHIIHRLPDNNYTNGAILETWFDDSRDLKAGFGHFFEELSNEISRSTRGKKEGWIEGNRFTRDEPFDIDDVLKWISAYDKIEFVKETFVWLRYNNNNVPDLKRDLRLSEVQKDFL